MDVVQARIRRRSSKVKTGCGTCKVRRVKCDETQPKCLKCSSTGRKCDGYISDITISSQTRADSINIIQRVSTHIPGSTEEKRGFSFFIQNTAAELTGYYDSPFWERLILAASAQKPALRHAVIALGALHEDFSRPSNSPAEILRTQFATIQYAKALGALRKSLAAGNEEPLTALISCILFVAFDSLRGWYESAMVHLQSGLRILRDLRKSSAECQFIEDSIAPLLLRLSIQSVIYVEARSKHEKIEFAADVGDISAKALVVPDEFETLVQARNYLATIMDGLLGAFYVLDEDLPLTSQPVDSILVDNKHSPMLHLWNLAFERLMMSKSKAFTSREIQGAALLKIHHTTAKRMAAVPFETSKTGTSSECADAGAILPSLQDYQIIVNLSRSLIVATEQDIKTGKPPLTFSSDLGLVGPLYYVCIGCSNASVCEAAMELLLRCPRREGMWNSVVIAQMIQQYWDLKARHEVQNFGDEVMRYGDEVPEEEFTDSGSVHFAYFGRPTELDPFAVSPIISPRATTRTEQA